MSSAFFFLRINDHVQYLRRLEKTLAGTGDFRGAPADACKLGLWLQGEGRGQAEEIGSEAVALFNELIEPHKGFHESSFRALEMKERGDEAGSRDAITEMMKLSLVLINKLTELDKLSTKRG
jgi:hypothetical protein